MSSNQLQTAMHTVASLKKQHKTLAAAKAFHSLKARSWADLVAKINPDLTIELRAEIDRLKAENAELKQQLAIAQNTDSDYFVSPQAEIVYSIIKLDGEQRLKALGINKSHFKDANKAKKWRNDIAKKVHPDKCAHPQAAQAMDEITAIFENMVAA
jgi:cell division protein FtsB